MLGEIYEIKPKNESVSFAEFTEKLHQSGLLNEYSFHQIPFPVYQFRQEFLDYISEHGISSLYNLNMAMEDITSPSMSINDIENVVIKFLANLQGAKTLVVIDPYLYNKSSSVDIPALFKRLLTGISSSLEKIIFVTNGKKTDNQLDMHNAVTALNSNVQIQDIITDEFHDRFWIDPENNTGVVMGTSLNGLGKKIALVEKLATSDVTEIANLARTIGVPV